MGEMDEVCVDHEKPERNGEAHDLTKPSVTLGVGPHVWLLRIPATLHFD